MKDTQATSNGRLTRVLVGLVIGASAVVTAASSFAPTGSMSTARYGHTSTVLLDGTVLMTGGDSAYSHAYLASAEIYDPATGLLTPTIGNMSTPRFLHTATRLADGKVLVTGGKTGSGISNSAEIYDPGTGSFTPTTGNMSTPRWYIHTATILLDGTVLVAGGITDGSSGFTASAEIYDPGTGTFSPTGSLSTRRHFHTATRLVDGRVLVVGGNLTTNGTGPTASAEIYDPGAGTFSSAGSTSSPLWGHTATLLATGNVLVTGGYSGSAWLDDAEVYDLGTGLFSPTSSMNTARYFHTATRLTDGTVLITGGKNSGTGFPASAEIYDPNLGSFTTTASSMTSGRALHRATFLADGTVLITGGDGGSGFLASAEIYGVGDTDGDGVSDADDACPGTAAGSVVNSFGCASEQYVGQTGPTGPQGLPGANGLNGTNGAPGPTGPQGLTGPAGPAGTNGVDGINGTEGTNGANGATGPQGEGFAPGSLVMLPAGSPAPPDSSFVGTFDFLPSRTPGGLASTKSTKSTKSSKGGGNQRLAVDVYLRN